MNEQANVQSGPGPSSKPPSAKELRLNPYSLAAAEPMGDEPGLGRLWDAVASRLQRNGLRPSGVVLLDGLDRDERRAVAGLLGRPLTAARIRVDLAELDERLRSVRDGQGVIAIAEDLRGPLVDRPASRLAARQGRAAVWAAARDALDRCDLAGQGWTERWLEELRSTGTIARIDFDHAATLLVRAVQTLTALPLLNGTVDRIGRTELASQVSGSSHGLDDGQMLAGLVLRGIAQMTERTYPASAAERRALWESAGVMSDEISTTVLTLGMRPPGVHPLAAGVRARSEANCETHLSLRDLRRIDTWVTSGAEVFVCENPRVLEAAMDEGASKAMVCTAGNPRIVVNSLLVQLAAGGAHLRYRGDFDWPGIGIANRIIETHGASPWRMGAGDYEEAIAQAGTAIDDLPTLDGRPLEAVWDPELSPLMVEIGRVVHEEALLGLLVADLLR